MIVDVDHASSTYGCRAAVSCWKCQATNRLRLVDGRFQCRDEAGCLYAVTYGKSVW